MTIFRRFRSSIEFVFALFILFEEWGWYPLKRSMARLMSLPVLAQISRWIGTLSPYGALAALLMPSLVLVPIKLAALWLIHQGHPLLGVSVIVAAKLAGTALLAHLFQLAKPALMRLAWFARIYGKWSAWKAHLLARVRASWSFRLARYLKRVVRRRINKFSALMADN